MGREDRSEGSMTRSEKIGRQNRDALTKVWKSRRNAYRRVYFGIKKHELERFQPQKCKIKPIELRYVATVLPMGNGRKGKSKKKSIFVMCGHITIL